MLIRTEGRILVDRTAGTYEAPHILGYKELSVFHVPQEEPYIAIPMGPLSLKKHDKVILRSYDGSGQYALGIITAISKGKLIKQYTVVSEKGLFDEHTRIERTEPLPPPFKKSRR